MDVDPEWFRDFFGPGWQNFASLKDGKTQAELDFIISVVDIPAGAEILDVPVGFGRHAAELAGRGFTVTGVDLNDLPLAAAHERCATAGVGVSLIKGDMRDLPVDGPFRLVLNLWNSFGYFAEKADDVRALDGFVRVLAPGGALVIEGVNPTALARHFEPRGWEALDDGGLRLDEHEVDLEVGRILSSHTLINDDGSRQSMRNSVRIYPPWELREMAEAAGCTDVRVYDGALDGRPLRLSSWRYLLVARKHL